MTAIAVADRMGWPWSAVDDGLTGFRGVDRRLQTKAELHGTLVVDDYAHHPTAVRETVAAIRDCYPGQRLWALFEAESNTSRRRVFQDAYPGAFQVAD